MDVQRSNTKIVQKAVHAFLCAAFIVQLFKVAKVLRDAITKAIDYGQPDIHLCLYKRCGSVCKVHTHTILRAINALMNMITH